VKLLVVHPGASWATHDVHMGVVEGLRTLGVQLSEFRLDGRIERTNGFLHYLWRKQKREQPELKWPKPTPTDVLYQASQGLVERALERGCTDILVVSAMFLLPDRLELARRAGLRVWLLCTETPYDIDQELRVAKLAHGVWTHERTALDRFAAVSPRAGYLPHAWRDGIHNGTSAQIPDGPDVLFCGSFFKERIEWFEQVDWSGINLHLYGIADGLSKHSPIRQYFKGAIVPNDQLPRLAQSSKIVMNIFRATTERAESLNPRCYEMAASGVCMVSDTRAELVEKFGDAVPTFSTPTEASTLIRDLIHDPQRREQCARVAAQSVAHDTWTHRAQQIIDDIRTWCH
jgi:hypothetical protein